MNKKSVDFSELTTERLLLRKVKKQDAEAIFFLRSDAEVNKFILRNPTKSIEEAEIFISERIKDIESNKVYYWAITQKDNPKLIGSICLWNFNKDRTFAEIGYDLHPSFQKQGIMNESMNLVLDFGFNKLQLNTIEAFTHRENLGSIQLLKRNQFTLEEHRIDEGFPHNIIFSLDQSKH
ncbi:MAG: GNAT family N-acetyltransferase [Flavobacteriaceae bacterium]|nr:GNAT family N-acetyltransferase [Flavobacteriaceae bacterium]